MTVYVDDMRMQATVRSGRGSVTARWSHLTADSDAELHAFAERLGLKREWFQPNSLGRVEANHYDVTDTKRTEAIRLGAVPETMREGARRRRAATDARLGPRS